MGQSLFIISHYSDVLRTLEIAAGDIPETIFTVLVSTNPKLHFQYNPGVTVLVQCVHLISVVRQVLGVFLVCLISFFNFSFCLAVTNTISQMSVVRYETLQQ
jgi:hypothetical protein